MKPCRLLLFVHMLALACSNVPEVAHRFVDTRSIQARGMPDISGGAEGEGHFLSSKTMAEIDALCPQGSDSQSYKALFADGVNRIASITGNAGDGQKDWALLPRPAYIRSAGGNDIAFITNENGILDLTDSTFMQASPVDANSGDNQNPIFYSGLNSDWTTSPALCDDGSGSWTDKTSGKTGTYGDLSTAGGTMISAGSTTCDGLNPPNSHKPQIACAQQ